MARGTNGGNSDLELFFLKITGVKEGEKIHIKQTKAVEKGKHIELDETIQDISGTLHKVEAREYAPREGEKAHELKVWLKDENLKELYAVGVNMNNIGRGILNTILALEPPYGELMIRVYNKKDEKAFPAVYITHNGVKAGWKYTPDELKKYITETSVKQNGVTKIVKDFWDLNQFLIKELNETVVPRFSKVPSQFQDAQANGNGAPLDVLVPDGIGEDDEDLPDFLKD